MLFKFFVGTFYNRQTTANFEMKFLLSNQGFSFYFDGEWGEEEVKRINFTVLKKMYA